MGRIHKRKCVKSLKSDNNVNGQNKQENKEEKAYYSSDDDFENFNESEISSIQENNVNNNDNSMENIIEDESELDNELDVSYLDGRDERRETFKLKDVNKTEYESLRAELESELPTLEKIMNSKITRTDKKQCLKLYRQFLDVSEKNSDYYRLIDNINNYLQNTYSDSELAILEQREEKLKAEEKRLEKLHCSLSCDNLSDCLKTKILELHAPENVKAKLLSRYREMMSYPQDNSNYNSLREELEWAVKIPYERREIDSYVNMSGKALTDFYKSFLENLDKALYGMRGVKERFLHIWNDRKTSGDACARNLALCGNPGCGKSAICKAVANTLGKKFAKISAAALDSAALKGSNKVWIGSEPSFILQLIAEFKTNNILIMIDEVDKLDIKSQYALLHVIDAADNMTFQDNYLKGISHDLSKIMFVLNMNTTSTLDAALLDRLDVVNVPDYNLEEKIVIVNTYMLPRILEMLGMGKNTVTFEKTGLKKFLEERKVELRDLEKIIKNICGKINLYATVKNVETLNLSYTIPNFKLPIKLNYNLIQSLSV